MNLCFKSKFWENFPKINDKTPIRPRFTSNPITSEPNQLQQSFTPLSLPLKVPHNLSFLSLDLRALLQVVLEHLGVGCILLLLHPLLLLLHCGISWRRDLPCSAKREVVVLLHRLGAYTTGPRFLLKSSWDPTTLLCLLLLGAGVIQPPGPLNIQIASSNTHLAKYCSDLFCKGWP